MVKKCRAMRIGMQLCTTCTVWVSAAPCPGLPPSLPPCLPAAPALAHILQVRGPPSVWRKARKSLRVLHRQLADI